MRLAPNALLDDEIINFMMSMLVNRNSRLQASGASQSAPFFFEKITESRGDHPMSVTEWSYNCSMNALRWHRVRRAVSVGASFQTSILEYDRIYIPINLPLHWVMACIDTQTITFIFWDSYCGDLVDRGLFSRSQLFGKEIGL
jgi:Ulp1 family protease